MADLKKSPSLKARAKHSPQSPLPQSKRRKRSVSTFLQGDVTLTDKAYAQIEELIVTLQLPPGTVLSELVLADRLGIGRTPIREALQRLSRDGLVNILARRGVLVSEIDLRAQLRLLEVRRELERLMARSAAERAHREAPQAVLLVFSETSGEETTAAALKGTKVFAVLPLPVVPPPVVSAAGSSW